MNYMTESDSCRKLRWTAELEFVQLLSNPWYINRRCLYRYFFINKKYFFLDLAQNDYLKRRDFVNYLNYLQYWKRPEYAQHLRFPQCLFFLDLLQNEEFRNSIANQQVARFIDDQLLLHWHNYARRRQRHIDLEATKFGKATESTNVHQSENQLHLMKKD